MSVLVIAVLAVSVLGISQFRVDTNIDSFLPAGDPSVSSLQDKARSFGGDAVVAVVESNNPDGFLTNEQQLGKLLQLEGKLAGVPDVAAVYGPATTLNQTAIAAQNMLARISGKRDALQAEAEQKARAAQRSDSEVQAQSRRAVADFEQRYGSLLVQGLPAGLPTLHNPKFVHNVIYGQSGAPRPQWDFVVPNKNSVAIMVRPRANIDQGDTQALLDATRSAIAGSGLDTKKATVTGIPTITAGVADQVADELPLLGGLVLVAMVIRFWLIPARAGLLRRFWPLAAAVIGSGLTIASFGLLGLSMSAGAAALVPLLVGIGSSFPLYLSTVADRRLVTVVSLASAAAFGSLAVSPLPFVRELGIALAVGVVLTVGVALLVGPRSMIGEAPHGRQAQRSAVVRAWSPARRWTALSVLVLIAGLGWAALPSTPLQADPRELASGLPELGNAQYAERVLGSSGEINVVLSGADVLSPQSLQWAKQAEENIIAEHGDAIRPILTLPDLLQFLGPTPTSSQVAAGVQMLPSYLTGAVAKADGQQAVMTFGLKIQDIGQQAQMLDSLRSSLPQPPDGFHAEIVGLPVAADRGYALLSDERYVANTLGIAAAGVILVVGLRRRSDALRGVLAAILATGWTLAAMWVCGASLSPLTVALGSLTTVTACEFTVLLMHAERGSNAWLRRTVGLACVTSAAGYLALVPSSLWLLREFGLVLTGTVLCSYVAARAVAKLVPDRQTEPGTAHTHAPPRKIARKEMSL